MKCFRNIAKIFILSALCLTAYVHVVHAAGSVTLTADKETCAVGDDYKITVTADNPADASVAPEISITYDTRRLSFKDCSCSYGGGGGGLISLNDTNADITFSVLSGGTAVVEASAVFDGDGANAQTASVTLSVDGEDTASMEEAGGSADLGIEGGSIAGADSSKLVSAVFADEFMPMGFYKTSVTYEEQLVEAAQFDMGNIVLLYVTDENGNNGNFNVYDQETGELSDFLQISGIENRFIIVLRAIDAETEAPDGFTLATLQWNEQTLDAYAHDGLTDFFLIYAISSEGNKGWYMYDQKDGTYQRFVNELYSGKGLESEGIGDKTDDDKRDDEDGILGGIDVKLIVIITLIAVMLGLLTAVIIMGIKLHEFNSYEYIDEDEYEEPQPRTPDRTSNKTPDRTSNKTPDKTNAKTITASDLVMREMNSEMPKSDNIYEKYRKIDENVQQNEAEQPDGENIEPIPPVTKSDLQTADLQQSPSKQSDWDDDYDLDLDSRSLSRSEKKALKAEEKARKKAEKKLKKEYGEFGPADFSHWQEAVRDDRKVSEEDLQDAKSRAADASAMLNQPKKAVDASAMLNQPKHDQSIPAPDETMLKPTLTPKAQKIPPAPEPEPADIAESEPFKHHVKRKQKKDVEEQVDIKKDSYVKMMKKLPANDNNEPVQPKPVQQFDLDDDFEFEFLNLDEDD